VLDPTDGRHSVFSGALLALLEGADEGFDVDRAHRSVVERVAAYSSTAGVQIPQLLRIAGAQDEGGSFFFVPRAGKAEVGGGAGR
jgi:hypothetical protein